MRFEGADCAAVVIDYYEVTTDHERDTSRHRKGKNLVDVVRVFKSYKQWLVNRRYMSQYILDLRVGMETVMAH